MSFAFNLQGLKHALHLHIHNKNESCKLVLPLCSAGPQREMNRRRQACSLMQLCPRMLNVTTVNNGDKVMKNEWNMKHENG